MQTVLADWPSSKSGHADLLDDWAVLKPWQLTVLEDLWLRRSWELASRTASNHEQLVQEFSFFFILSSI